MFIPLWLFLPVAVAIVLILMWSVLATLRRNPLPFPDPGSRIFSASSPEAKEAIVELLKEHGLKERFRVDTSGIVRSILWDGTIINARPPAVAEKLGGAAASIGIVASNPRRSARAAAKFLRDHGYTAEVIEDVEPDLPISFVVTNAFVGTVLNFRKHMIHLPRPRG